MLRAPLSGSCSVSCSSGDAWDFQASLKAFKAAPSWCCLLARAEYLSAFPQLAGELWRQLTSAT